MKQQTSACSNENMLGIFANFNQPEKPAINGLTKEELAQTLLELGQKPFRAAQIWHWLTVRGVKEFSQMNNVSKQLRDLLAEKFTIFSPQMTLEQISSDGTRKWLLKMPDGHEIETVYIPDENRGTLCVSSQIGCGLTCSFCHTGTQKLVRNLKTEEILGQLLFAKDRLNDWEDPKKRQITNIVMMGMGEPLLNYDNVAKFIKIAMDGEGLAISKRKITLSTSGLVPQIEKTGEELGVELAISLHATTDELRDEIVPINKKYKIEQLLNACRNYRAGSNTRRITFEYVMLKNVNDSDQDAKRLVNLIKDIPAKVNLIPFNPWPNSPYECSSKTRIDKFAKIVKDAGYSSPVRTPRGQDILAACGQLKSDSIKKSKSILKKGENSNG